MNKYPLDSAGVLQLVQELLNHNDEQNKIIIQLSNALAESMTYVDEYQTGEDWYCDAEKLLLDMNKRNHDYQNLRFDQQNGHKQGQTSPYEENGFYGIVDVPSTSMVPHENQRPNRGRVNPGEVIDRFSEGRLNSVEANFGSEMSEDDLKAHFGETALPPKKRKKEKHIMTLEEIDEWEKRQDNSNDIYKLSARVKNLARDGGAALTPVGEMMCNTYTHVLKSLYDFAETIEDKTLRIRLTDLIRSKEGMPGDLISATAAQVRNNKKR